MHLYFNGDSFVAGSELGDNILPDYPGLTEYGKRQSKDVREWYSTVVERRQQCCLDTIIKLEYERSFPNKVATKLNLPFTNNALGGSSMDRIARTTVTDLIELKKNNPNEKIIAVIGVTSFTRTELPALGFKQVDIRYSKSKWRSNIDHKESIDAGYTDYHRLVHFYKNIIFVKDFCKANDITLLWVNFWKDLLKGHNYSDKDFSAFKEYANIEFIIDSNIFLIDFEGQKIFCPGGHLAEPVHDFVADKLVEIIKGIL